MKNSLFILLFALAAAGCKDRKTDRPANVMEVNGKVDFKDSTSINLLDPTYDFGKITEGEKVGFSYRFVNMGPNKLIIAHAQPSCGCTVAETPKDPINVGDTGYIQIVFDSKGKPGATHKTISVTANANFPPLGLTGEVVMITKN